MLHKKKKLKNKFEERTYLQLKRSKVPFKYESEKIPYVIASHYTPDFVITTPTGLIYVETKGYFRPEDKRKLAAVKRQHPEMDLRLVFYTERPQYIKWCTKHGFKWAIDKIPKDWLVGL